MKHSRPLLLLIALLVISAAVPTARAEIFELKNGGQLTGSAERTESGEYVIRTVAGATVTIDRDEVARIVQEEGALDEYTRRSRTAPDTADAHRELVAWCREQKLMDQAEHHLQRVVDLDPADEDARRSLGYQQVGGRWLTRDEVMAARGLHFYDGKFRTPQDIAIRQRDKQSGDAELDWFTKLRKWRGWLDKRRPGQVEEAQAQIAAFADPQAAPAIARMLDEEEDEYVFELLLSVLGRLDHPAAVQTLVAYSLDYDDAEIRLQCLDYLTSSARPVSILPYVKALKSKDNAIVNRAGEALGKIGDPAAVSPLIDALVTTHKYQVQDNQSGQLGASFNPSGGGGGLSLGGGPKIIQRDQENLRVQRALIKLSGNQDFGFDEKAWRAWYVDQQMRQHVNSRRDQ
jgi:hypothetical protein